jgi:hypothetical protein
MDDDDTQQALDAHAKGRLSKERCCHGCDRYLLCQYDSKVRDVCVLRDLTRSAEYDLDDGRSSSKCTRRTFVNGKLVRTHRTRT